MMGEDILKARLVEQGYVPETCQIGAHDVITAVEGAMDPCATCVVDRRVCKGRPERKLVAHKVEGEGEAPGMGRPNVYYFSGVDPAAALGLRSDDGSIAIGRVWPKSPTKDANYFSDIVTDWHFGFVGAYRLRKMRATQWSGKLHELFMRYGLTMICMDPGGGGLFIQGELRNPIQKIMNMDRQVRPICTLEDTDPDAHPILRMFKRGDAGIDAMWQKMAGDDLLPDQMHTVFLDALETGGIMFPVPWKDRKLEERQRIEREWAIADVWSLKNLSAGMQQLTKGQVLTDDEGEWITTKRGAKQFEWVGKKDIAYAMIYCYMAFRMWLKSGMQDEAGGDEEYAGDLF